MQDHYTMKLSKKKKRQTEANENLNKKRLIDEIDELKKRKRFKVIIEKQRESDFIDEKIREFQMLIIN